MEGQVTAGVFAGLRVLDFTSALAGPTTTRLLAEMGAEVLKVEPPGGEMSRTLAAVKNGRSGYFIQQNRGKRSLGIDLKTEEGRQIILDLVPSCDVVVQNQGPGVMKRLGLAWEVLSEINPRLIMCSISAFGDGGSLSDKPGYDYIAQAYAGTLHMVGDPDGAPAMAGTGTGDVLTGTNGLAAVAAALYHREKTGVGQHVSASLVDCHLSTHEMNFEVWSLSDDVEPKRAGPMHPVVGGCGVYPSGDGYVVVAAATDAMWAGVCRAMGAEELIDDQRFVTSVRRTTNRDLTNQIVTDWLAIVDDRDQAVLLLEAERVPVAPVLSVSEAATHPHNVATGGVRQIVDELAGLMTIPGMPIKMSAFPTEAELSATSLGADNEAILSEILGWDETAIAAARAANVIHQNPQS